METIRYTLIGKEDLRLGKNTFQVTLADGRVVTLTEVDIGALLNDTSLSTQTLAGKTLSGTTTLSGLTASTMLYLNASKELASTAAPTNGQLLIGSTGAVPALGTLTGLGSVTITNSAGGISIEAGGEFIGSLELAATVAANALTVSLKNSAGNDPTSAAPVNIRFRDTTLTSGGYTSVAVTSDLSVTLSAGSPLGFTTAQTDKIYILAINNAGAAELGLLHLSQDGAISSFDEAALISTTAEGGVGGADSEDVVYSTTARTNVTFRILGYLTIQTGATAGNWSNAPTVIQVMGPGVTRPIKVGRFDALVSSTSLPAANSVSITDIPQTYSTLLLVIAGASSDTATRRIQVQVSTNNGSSYDTTAANYVGANEAEGTGVTANNEASVWDQVNQNASAAQTVSFGLQIIGYQAGAYPIATGNGAISSGSQVVSWITYIGSTDAVNALKIIWNGTGNFDAGTYALYGVN